MVLAKTLQIFIPDGNPRSVRIAEITNRTVQAILIPRSKLDYAASRDEVKNVSVYFLIGNPDEAPKPRLYIGEAEDCLARLRQHNRSKDFWEVALAVISPKVFTKAHVKFLEWYCSLKAKEVGRYHIEGSTTPAEPFVSEPMKASLLDSFDSIKVLVSTLGYPVFEAIRKPEKQDILICKGKDAYAEGEYTEDGLVVFKGSRCILKESRTVGSWIINMRQKLLQDKTLVQDGNVYKFTSDHVFSSPSAAAAVVLARNASGWTEWKYRDGKTLDEVKRKGSAI